MRPLVLKLAASGLTLAMTVASALFVTSHLKNAAAPLQPSVLASSTGVRTVVVVSPGVQPATTPPITSTYAS